MWFDQTTKDYQDYQSTRIPDYLPDYQLYQGIAGPGLQSF